MSHVGCLDEILCWVHPVIVAVELSAPKVPSYPSVFFPQSRFHQAVIFSSKLKGGSMPELKTEPLPILIDSRERRPYRFEEYSALTSKGTIKTGDYTLLGMESLVAVERKSLDDLIGCLTVGRARFERELDRARVMACFAVVVEASMEDVTRHRYTSRMAPHSALQSILAFQVRYSTPFMWAGSRESGEYLTFWFLEKAQRELLTKKERAA